MGDGRLLFNIMHIFFHKIPKTSDSQYRGIGFYTRYLVEALQKEGVEMGFFSAESELIHQPSIINHQSEFILHYPFISPYFHTSPYRSKFKRMITVHDLIPLKFPKLYPSGIKGKIKWQINKRIIQKAEAIIADSLTSKNDILSYCWPISAQKIHIVPLAADSTYKPLKIKKMPTNLRTYEPINLQNFVLYVGDVNPSKNLPMLIKACVDLKLPLVLVGKKITEKNYDKNHPENKDLAEVQKLAIKNPKLIFPLGFVSDEELVKLFNLATIYCQPSLEEGFGLPVLEAMACGCPAAVSQTSALVEITKTNAFLFDPVSIDSMKTALKEAFSNQKKRKEFSAWGLKRAGEYSWQKTAKQTIEVYKSLI